MAKDITLKSPNGEEIYYPKTVSDLVYDNETGQTVKDALNKIKEDGVTGLSDDYRIVLENIVLDPLFIQNRFISNAEDYKQYLPKDAVISDFSSNYSSLSMSVKQGDEFMLYSISGSGGSSRAYSIFDINGNIIETAEPVAIIKNKNIKINQDGYIVFVALNTSVIHIKGIRITVTLDWAYSYLAGLINHFNKDNSIYSKQERGIELKNIFSKNKYFNLSAKRYIPGNETISSEFDCISIKVYSGDFFEVKNIRGGSAEAYTYGIFNSDGDLISYNKSGTPFTGTINIEQNGYLVINTYHTDYSVIGHFKWNENWLWQYTPEIVDKINTNTLDIQTIQEMLSILSADALNDRYIDNVVNYTPYSGGGNYNTTRIVYDTRHVWKKNDRLIKVNIPIINTGTAHTFLYIYNSSKELKRKIDLGIVTNTLIDVYDKYIILDDNDIVALKTVPYVDKTGETNFYDLNSNSVIQNIAYNFGFVFLRPEKSVKDKVSSISDDLYGTYKKYISSEWQDGFIIVDTTQPISFAPIVKFPGYKYIILECKEGDKFKIYIKGGTASARAWSFLDNSRRVITQSTEGNYIDTELIAPENTAYVVFNAVTNDSIIETGYHPIWKPNRKSIKILCFGNSFTQDSMGYVPAILSNLCPDLDYTIGIAYIGGCTLVQHLANFTGETQHIGNSNFTPANYIYYKCTNINNKWLNLGEKSVDELIASDEWDIITFQQGGGTAYLNWETHFEPFIFKLHKSLFDKIGYGVKIGWLLTQGAYAEDYNGLLNHWQGTADNSKKMLEVTGTSILFPFGTAVQNLRTTSLKDLGDGDAHNLMADTGHLQEGIGCLTAAYTNAIVILKYSGFYDGVIGDKNIRPDAEFISNYNIPGPNLATSGVIGISENNCYLAQVAAECAIKNPYLVTDLSKYEL